MSIPLTCPCCIQTKETPPIWRFPYISHIFTGGDIGVCQRCRGLDLRARICRHIARRVAVVIIVNEAQHLLQTGGALQCRLVPRSLEVSVVDDDVVRPVPRCSLLRQFRALPPCAIIGPWLQLLRPDLLAIFGHRKLLHAHGRCGGFLGRIMFLQGGVTSREALGQMSPLIHVL
jgi:hypothetical protein